MLVRFDVRMSRGDVMRRITGGGAVLLVLCTVPSAAAAQDPPTSAADTVRVAAPTGQPETDQPNVQEAFDRVDPGDVVLFAPGTYLLGEGARLTVPDVTVLGHPDGTVLQGCEPERFELPAEGVMEAVGGVAMGCAGLYLLADRQTIRGITFDHTWHGIHVGKPVWLRDPPGEGPPERGFGGHLIENNVFRHVPNGIRVVGPVDDVTVIRGNVVENAYHAFQSNGAPVHVIDNRITVPDPESVPASHYPESGVILGPGPSPESCTGSRVTGNLIEGTVHGIQVRGGAIGACADHEIRDNEIRVREVPLPPDYPRHLMDFYFEAGSEGSTVTGIAIRLDGETGGPVDDTTAAAVTGVLVQDNRVLGGHGLGIQVARASHNRIVGNHISGIRRRTPFPGLTWGDDATRWREANGSGIWISPDSEDNEVTGNTFEDLAGTPVFIGSEGGAATGYTFPSCELSVEGPHGTGEIRSVHVTMRDGVRIALDVVLPDPLPQAGTVPTILEMTRYWRSEEGRPPGARERLFTSHGYALVVGDVRGTGASFGRWPYHRSEAETRDFVEIIDWIVEQPWSDGRVVGVGSSYTANTADWMSVRGHPALKAVVSRFPDFDPYADLYFPGGVPNAYMGREWGTEVKEMDLNVKRPYEDGPRGIRPVDADSAGRLLARAVEERRDVPSVWEGLRTVTYRDDAPEDWDGASVDDWGTQDRTDAIERWGGPIQSWASWMDAGTANGVLHRLMTLENPQQAFIGAWSHGGWQDADPFRPVDAEARPPAPLQFVETLCFVERQLRGGTASEREPEPRLVYYTMGEGRWKTTDEWPPAGVENRPLYLAAGNRLSPSLPTAESTDAYVVDTTATTGTTNRWATNATGGDVVYDDRAAEAAKFLTYTSDPLPHAMEITGQPVAHLSVSSSHEDGAFFVYLEAVAPDGTVVYLTEGMLRALHRKVSTDEPPYRVRGPFRTFERANAMPLVPGRVASLAFELMPTSVLVPAGWRLRLSVAGADADTFGRVPEEGVPELEVHLGGDHASRVDLPVVPWGMW